VSFYSARASGFYRFFYFKVLEDLEADFLTGWKMLDGTKSANLFDPIGR
jgi:hypothetical protein